MLPPPIMMIKIADLPIDWQEDYSDFVSGFSSSEASEAVMNLRFYNKMPECHGIQYAGDSSEHFLRAESGEILFSNSDWSEVSSYFISKSDSEFALPLAALCSKFSYYEAFLVHASCVDYNGQGVLFTGYSEVGKTTQAELWNKFLNADIINGDKAFIRNVDGKFFAYGLPWKGSSTYCLNRKVPLKGIVVLRQSKINQITRLDMKATEYFMPHIFLPYWDKMCLNNALDTFNTLLEKVPVWLLGCRPDEEAVKLTLDTVLG